MKKNNTPFEVWGIERHEDPSKWAEPVNDGNHVVPTMLYSGGEYAANPSVEEVTAKYTEFSGK